MAATKKEAPVAVPEAEAPVAVPEVIDLKEANRRRLDEIRAKDRELVEVELSMIIGGEQAAYVNVGDHNAVVPRGVRVKIPRYQAKIFENSARQDRLTRAAIMQLENGNKGFNA